MRHLYHSDGSKRLRRLAGLLVACAMLAGEPASAVVVVNVTRVGYPSIGRPDVVRTGAWVPVIVDLELTNQTEFFGSVRVGQRDLDGDECYDSATVRLHQDSAPQQRVVLYALANSNPMGIRGHMVVELFDDAGNAVQLLTQGELGYQAEPDQPAETISDDSILIVSMATGAMGKVRDLLSPDRPRRYTRTIHLGHMSPSELPELWIGLETVDHIVWDDAQPEALTDAQLSALIAWVKRGGTLLIAASRSAGSIKLMPTLREVLPVDLGELVRVEQLPTLRRTLLDPPPDDVELPSGVRWWDLPFEVAIPMVQCTRRDGAEAVFFSEEHATDVLSRRRLGLGQIVFCAVTLGDLFSVPGRSNKFFETLLNLPIERGEPEEFASESLFDEVVGAVAFNRRAGLYLMMMGFCSIGYVLAATFGSWTLLAAREWKQHAWSAFAVVGLGGTLLSIFAVNSVRGFGGETLHQLTIVDAEAGEAYGFATVYFGLKTGIDKRLDVWLPSDPNSATEPGRTDCFLRPMPVSSELGESAGTFADPEDYRLKPASALIEDVRIRGTLKRFEGRWEGRLSGTVTGNIAIEGKGVHARIRDGSYIINELGLPLRNCYLVHTAEDPADWTGSRAERIYVFPLGDLPTGGSRVDLRDRCYRLGTEPDDTEAKLLERRTLAKAQEEWGGKVKSLLRDIPFGVSDGRNVVAGEEENALLLLSTLGEYDPSLDSSAGALWSSFPRTWKRDRARQLDLRDRLRRNSVMLLGFADDPGPVRLFRRAGDDPFRPLKPDSENSWTMYRFRIPATLFTGRHVDEDDDDRQQ